VARQRTGALEPHRTRRRALARRSSRRPRICPTRSAAIVPTTCSSAATIRASSSRLEEVETSLHRSRDGGDAGQPTQAARILGLDRMTLHRSSSATKRQ
jgi:transcriptional regulator of acetoin/glycerol metabolism